MIARLAVEPRWTADLVIQALHEAYLMEAGAISFKEVELEPHHEDEKSFRRADMISVFTGGCAESYRFSRQHAKHNRPADSYAFRRLPLHWRTGWEIKISRADLACDLKQRWKQNPISRFTNETYLAIPRGILRWKDHGGWQSPDCELPWGMGIVEVFRDERPQWKGTLRAQIMRRGHTNLHPDTPLWFMSRLLECRRMS